MVRHATSAVQIEPMAMSRTESAITSDVKRALTAAVAQELHKIHGGNEVLDWLEAEILVDGVLARDGLQQH